MTKSRGLLVRAMVACALAVPVVAAAQPSAGSGFLFGAPRGTLTLRAGFAQPSAGSDVFTFVQDQLTLGRGDFGAQAYGAGLALRLTDRVQWLVDAGYSARKVQSEYRDWVDNNDLAIEQSTILRRLPVTLGLRYYLTAPGRTLGRLAWVPARVAPFVSGGVGATHYEFRQSGDFVDFQTKDVFSSTLKSRGWAPTAFGSVGVDYSIIEATALVIEARYDLASAPMSRDFSGFQRIDLSGVALTAGFFFRF